jgi:hypothetical protein
MGVFSWIRSRALPLYRSHTPSGISKPHSLLAGPGRDSTYGAAVKKAAAEDVQRLEEEGRYFDPKSPGNTEDDL